MTDGITIDAGHDRPVYSSVCTFCARFDLYSRIGAETCEAFPGGIPDPIWYGQNTHRKPVEGDGGLRFMALSDGPDN